jgi:hypothetical protein
MKNFRERAAKENQKLINVVIENIKRDILSGDLTAVAELIKRVPREALLGYLPEAVLWNEYRKDSSEDEPAR